jgi:TolB-like protein/DNA-binding winged helix-turn-helix (wHTH) protein
MSTDFRVGLWLVEPSLNSISRDGTTARLEPKVMEVLVCLAEHPRETISKETLLQTVWPGTFVSDDVLKHSVSELRRVFDDDAHEPRVIQTIAKRGYRLVAPVERGNGLNQSSTLAKTAPVHKMMGSSARRLWAGATVAIVILLSVLLVGVQRIRSARAGAVPSIHSLAVLPLQNLSADPAQEYFSDGITDALITDLAQNGSVKVISRTSIMRYKKTEKSLPEIARELGVEEIVEGTVQRSGDRVRITAQLIDGPSDKHLWANTYDGDIHDTLALESNVTEDIARHVQERITAGTAVQARQGKHVDAKVLEAFLQGNYHLQTFGNGGGDEEQRKAAEYFQQAIDTDPDFAPAYVGLARAHLWLLWPSKQDAKIVKQAAERALALDPNLSDAHTLLADMNVCSWNWQAGEEEFHRALAVNPNNVEAHEKLGELFFIMGKLDEGYREFEVAQTLDPSFDHFSDALERQGLFDRAIDMELMLLKRYPHDGYLHVELTRLYLKQGMYKEAYFHMNQAAMAYGFPENPTRADHDISDYRRAIRDSLRDYEVLITTHQAFIPMNLAEVYAALGDKDRAFYWLEWAYAQHDLGVASGDLHLERLNLEYLLDPIRSDPRFKDLVRRVGLPR